MTRAARLHHFREASGQDCLQDAGVPIGGKGDDGQRALGLSAHGVNVAQSVGGRDLSEGVGIVHDWGKEIDGLHQGQLGRNQIHSGVVGLVEANQYIRVLLPG